MHRRQQFTNRIRYQARRRAQFMEFRKQEDEKSDKSTQETTSLESPPCISQTQYLLQTKNKL